MQINPYLSFSGDCEEAFTFYERCFGGRLGGLFRYAASHMADQAPDDWSNKIMHGTVTLPGLELSGADVVPERHQEPRGFSRSVQLAKTEDAENGSACWSIGSAYRG